jgi:hypothetical protein
MPEASGRFGTRGTEGRRIDVDDLGGCGRRRKPDRRRDADGYVELRAGASARPSTVTSATAGAPSRDDDLSPAAAHDLINSADDSAEQRGSAKDRNVAKRQLKRPAHCSSMETEEIMKTLRISLAATIALLLLAACGNLGGILGGSPNTYPSSRSTEFQGSVTNVDTRAQRIDIATNSNYPNNGYVSSVYYDNRTRFSYGNRDVSPNDLRRGDQIDVRAYDNGNGQYTADTVYVVNSGMASNYPGTTYPGSSQTSDIQGTVNYIDPNAQRIDVTSAYSNGLRTNSQGNYSIYYDSRTPVYYQGQTYSPTSLERGDQIDARVYDSGGRYMADSITVTRNVRQ